MLHTKTQFSITYCYASPGELCWLHFIGHVLNFEGHVGRKSIGIVFSLKLYEKKKLLKTMFLLKNIMRNKQRKNRENSFPKAKMVSFSKGYSSPGTCMHPQIIEHKFEIQRRHVQSMGEGLDM